MIAVDRPARKHTPCTENPPLSHGEMPPRYLKVWTAPQCYRRLTDLSEASRGAETACMPSSQRSWWF